ncbi:glycosyltransferase family protein [Methylacidiphilum kamchatkense]|uniref:hypothetical protein n=1 Tax=Methylacidiphilum kamchatkense TaxID=431057 RepID=UPI0013792F0A|nr:hypothetical protein [Methylacidiphilum kamchatkense]
MILFEHKKTIIENREIPEITAHLDVELHSHPIVDGKIGKLQSPMIHNDYENLSHFFHKHNIYSDGEALLRTKYNIIHGDRLKANLFGSTLERRRWLKNFFLSIPGKPLIWFLYSYILKGGFLDGYQGLVFNILKSFYWYQISLKEYEIKCFLNKK